MKRIIVSAGLVALAAAGVQAADRRSEFASVDGSRPWSISATLRGFYDDNPGTQPSGPNKQGSFGYQVAPAVSLGLPLGQQTYLGLSYDYSMKSYEDQPVGSVDKTDQSHLFNAGFDHAFSERYQLSVKDSFVIGQEPDTLRAGNTYSTFQRIDGNNIRNYGAITLNAQMTRLFGLELGYANSYYNYDDSNWTLAPTMIPNLSQLQPSLSGTLDRVENLVHLDGRWQMQRDTVGIVGYQFGLIDYTADEPISGYSVSANNENILFNTIMSDARNSLSHYAYVGAEHDFRQDLAGSIRAGARYIDYVNDPAADSKISPYVQASLRYLYTTESFVRAGIGYDRNPTDRFSAQGNNITLDAESFVAFGTISHRIAPNLFGSLTGQIQNSRFNGGSIDDETENYYLIDANLEYRFNPHLSAEVGYNFDRSDSDISGGSFSRNRVYLGVTAKY